MHMPHVHVNVNVNVNVAWQVADLENLMPWLVWAHDEAKA